MSSQYPQLIADCQIGFFNLGPRHFNYLVEIDFQLDVGASQSRDYLAGPIQVVTFSLNGPIGRWTVGNVEYIADLVSKLDLFCADRLMRSVFDLQLFSYFLWKTLVIRHLLH